MPAATLIPKSPDHPMRSPTLGRSGPGTISISSWRTPRGYYDRMSSGEDRPDLHVIDIFMMSVKCGNCDPNVTRTIVEVPREFDNSTKRAEELPYYAGEDDAREESP